MSNALDGGMLVPEPAMVQMFPSGTYVDLLAPKAETIHAEDIAHHLGMLCRYCGGVRHFYSVAEHSCLVADLLTWQGYDTEMVLAGLLHDGAEAFVGDMIAPLKFAMRLSEARKYGVGLEEGEGTPGLVADDNQSWFVKPPRSLRGLFSDLAERVDHVIGERFGLDPEMFDAPEVKLADMWALRIEAAKLTYSRGEGWRWPGTLPEGGAKPDLVTWFGGVSPDTASAMWTRRLGLFLARRGGVES